MKMKTVKITDSQGNPLKGAHVQFEGRGTVSDNQGNATISVSDPNSIVEISHVSGGDYAMPFIDLPKYIVLFPNTLPEVVITAEKKKNTWLWLAVAGVTLVAIVSYTNNQPKKISI